jgi:Ca2+/Na+ antiporter
MSVLAAIRTHDVDLALVIHVGGAMILIGGLVTAVAATVAGWRDEAPRLRRFAVMTLLAVALPGWIVMRVGAEWTYSKEHWGDAAKQPTWLDIGFGISDVGGLLLLIALVLGAIGMRRSRQGGGDALLRASGAIAAVLVVAYAVVVWAMGGKPS